MYLDVLFFKTAEVYENLQVLLLKSSGDSKGGLGGP